MQAENDYEIEMHEEDFLYYSCVTEWYQITPKLAGYGSDVKLLVL